MNLIVIYAVLIIIALFILYVLIRYAVKDMKEKIVDTIAEKQSKINQAMLNYYADMAELGIPEDVAQSMYEYKLNNGFYVCTGTEFFIARPCSYYDAPLCLHPSNCNFKKISK